MTGLRERAGETVKVHESDTPSRTVQCRQCGAMTEINGAGVDAWRACNRALKGRGEEPLQKAEVMCCDREQCRSAERDEQQRRALRENNQTQSIVDAIKRGEAVNVPSEIIQYRRSCHARIKAALDARRAGTLPARDAEID